MYKVLVCCLAYNRPLITDSHWAFSLANQTVTLTEKQPAAAWMTASQKPCSVHRKHTSWPCTDMNVHLPCAFRTTLKSHLFMYENVCGPVQALAEFQSIDFPSPLLFITEEYPAPIEVFPEKQESVFNKRREKAVWLSSWNYLIAFINSSVNKCKRGVSLLVKN